MSVPLQLAAIAAEYEVGTGRTVPTVAAALGLAGAILGGLALSRPSRRTGRSLAALAVGTVALVVGGVHAANAAGGLGTGNGLAGAVVAVVLGALAVVLGGLALVRSRRTSV